jgi:hypothetical protein
VAIHEMASETQGLTWRSNGVRVMVLTTDAPFHTGEWAVSVGGVTRQGGVTHVCVGGEGGWGVTRVGGWGARVRGFFGRLLVCVPRC